MRLMTVEIVIKRIYFANVNKVEIVCSVRIILVTF